jgi:antitoxin (DNA-binding transcriptional repressor) of toxin-antitoxin stability system
VKAVGIKALKDNLSKYLRLVQAGEIIWVTDRDEVIAEIHKPTVPIPNRVSRWEAFLNDQQRKGTLKRAPRGSPPPLSGLRSNEAALEGVDLQAILDGLRSDRDLLH